MQKQESGVGEVLTRQARRSPRSTDCWGWSWTAAGCRPGHQHIHVLTLTGQTADGFMLTCSYRTGMKSFFFRRTTSPTSMCLHLDSWNLQRRKHRRQLVDLLQRNMFLSSQVCSDLPSSSTSHFLLLISLSILCRACRNINYSQTFIILLLYFILSWN